MKITASPGVASLSRSAGSPVRRVYLNEYNLRMGRMCYLPLVSGLLQAFAQTSPRVRAGYQFQPYLFHVDSLENILAQYVEPPDVAAFSLSMWNEQLNLRVAEEVKRRFPDCRIVVGGPQVPHDPTDYLTHYDFIDAAVTAEGEEPFRDLLERYLDGDNLDGIPQVAYRQRRSGQIIRCADTRPFEKSLDQYPSPYLEGLYDELLSRQGPDLEFQAIVETNRGCPFLCSFCYWGRGGLSRKYRFHDLQRVQAEIDWCGKHQIRYVFNADSNFGMHDRDLEIAQFIVETKQRYGFPEKFRTCYGKNATEKIFRIGSLFHRHQLEKGITLARQSNDSQTLKNIKRHNIKMSTYQRLQEQFNDEEIPIYSELILGLPGETEVSWQQGIDELLQAGLKNQLFIYLCQVLPNTDLADPAYRRQFGIVTRRIRLNEIHVSVRNCQGVEEFEEVVVATHSMSTETWRRCVVFSWLTMVLHSMKIGYFVLVYLMDRLGVAPSELIGYLAQGRPSLAQAPWLHAELARYTWVVDSLLEEGAGRGLILPEYGDIYWDIEEATFLRVSENPAPFYDELLLVLSDFLSARGTPFDPSELAEVVRYQQARIPTANDSEPLEHQFHWNLPEYFGTRFSSQPVPWSPTPQAMTSQPRAFQGDLPRFARETILWGRKSGTLLVPVEYQRTAVAAMAPVNLAPVDSPTEEANHCESPPTIESTWLVLRKTA